MSTKTAAVFLSARELPKYKKLVFETGQVLAEMGYDMVYGGGKHGLMGVAAAGVESKGGHARGFSTHLLFHKELKSGAYDKENTHFVHTMGERKQIQLEVSDIVVILPGGFGTLDELFETLTFNQLGITRQTIYILDPELELLLRALIKIYISRGTVSEKDVKIIKYVADPLDLMITLEMESR